MQPEVSRTTSPAVAATLAGQERIDILIVEDNEVNALILRAMLRKRGHEPLVARNGREGVEMARRHRPRLILMDLQMPELDGYAAAIEIRGGTAGHEPVLVAVTANAAAEVRTACSSAGFVCVLAKPIIFDDLLAVVARYLDASGSCPASRTA